MKLLGYTHAALLRMRLQDLVPDNERATLTAALDALRNGDSLRLECLLRHHDGRLIPTDFDGVRLADGNFCASCRDVSALLGSRTALAENAEALKQAQRIAGIGNWTWNVADDAHTWSEEIYTIYGRDPKLPAARYPEVPAYFTPESWSCLSHVIETALAHGTPYECDAEVIRADNSRRWITARGEATRDGDGKISGLHGTLQDITAHKESEAELRESETKYRLLAENAADWIFWLGLDKCYRYVSPACRQITGHAPDAFIADPELMPRIIHPDDRDFYMEHIETIAGSDERDLEFRIVRDDGEVRWISHHCVPIYDDGVFAGRHGANRDITERKHAQHELELHRHHLEDLDMSHEIRTPMNAIIGLTHVLRRSVSAP